MMEEVCSFLFVLFWVSLAFIMHTYSYQLFNEPGIVNEGYLFDDLRREVISMGCKKGKKGGK